LLDLAQRVQRGQPLQLLGVLAVALHKHGLQVPRRHRRPVRLPHNGLAHLGDRLQQQALPPAAAAAARRHGQRVDGAAQLDQRRDLVEQHVAEVPPHPR
jgi:hypothetical protein